MAHGYQIRNQEAAHFLTFQIVQWVDLFTRQVYRDIFIDSMKYCIENKGLEVYAYVIMSNHVHLLVRGVDGNLSAVIRDMKRHTSKKFVEAIIDEEESRRNWLLMIFKYAANRNKKNSQFQVWTHENHAEEIYSNNFIEQKIEYIHANPVKAGIVENPEDYIYSSARNYADLPGRVPVIKAVIRWKTI
jgi:REP element-mobilizing transposase RayT